MFAKLFRNKKEEEQEKITFKGMNRVMFKDTNVEYIPLPPGERSKVMKSIANYAAYYGLKVKFRLGVFTSIKDTEIWAEPVLRIEKIGEFEPKRPWKEYKPTGKNPGRPRKTVKKTETAKHTSKNYLKICGLLKQGKSVKEISEIVDVSRTYVYGIRKGLKNGTKGI